MLRGVAPLYVHPLLGKCKFFSDLDELGNYSFGTVHLLRDSPELNE